MTIYNFSLYDFIQPPRRAFCAFVQLEIQSCIHLLEAVDNFKMYIYKPIAVLLKFKTSNKIKNWVAGSGLNLP